MRTNKLTRDNVIRLVSIVYSVIAVLGHGAIVAHFGNVIGNISIALIFILMFYRMRLNWKKFGMQHPAKKREFDNACAVLKRGMGLKR